MNPAQKIANRMAGVYAITPDGWSKAALLEVVQAALEEGVRCVQYRDKAAWQTDADRKIATAIAIAALCQKFDACFIVNDDPALYLQVILHAPIDGCHVGRHDVGVGVLRAQLGAQVVLGASCYDNIELARQAAQQGASYLAFGAMFSSLTKPNAVKAPLELLSDAQSLGLPIVAIGGIDIHNIATIANYGASAAALVTSLFGHAPNVAFTARSARALVAAFAQGHAGWHSTTFNQ